MTEKRFSVDDDGIYDTQEKKHFKFIAYDWMECDIYECCDLLNEQQSIINILLEELVNAQQQGYVVGFLHKNEPCSLIPKELENE